MFQRNKKRTAKPTEFGPLLLLLLFLFLLLLYSLSSSFCHFFRLSGSVWPRFGEFGPKDCVLLVRYFFYLNSCYYFIIKKTYNGRANKQTNQRTNNVILLLNGHGHAESVWAENPKSVESTRNIQQRDTRAILFLMNKVVFLGAQFRE